MTPNSRPTCPSSGTGSYINLGFVLERAYHFPEAEALLRKGIELTEQLVAEYPEVSDYLLAHAKNHNGLGLSLWGQRQAGAAEREFQSAIRAMKKLTEVSPGMTEYQIVLAANCCNLGC